ncbi:MAG: tetratricopeptide repeat protein [Desulfosoma sp.]
MVHGLRLGLHATHTRLVLDCEGDLPAKVSYDSPREWTVSFDNLERDQGQKLSVPSPRGKIQKLHWIFNGRKAVLKISLKEPLSQAKIFTMENNLRGSSGYRLVIDFGLSGVSSMVFAQKDKASGDTPPESASKESDSKDNGLSPLESSEPLQPKAEKEASATTHPAAEPASSQPMKSPSSRIIRPIQAQSLHDLADMTYEELRDKLPETAEQIIAAYQKAVQKEPQHPRHVSALLRMAEISEKAGDVKKAERIYQRILNEHPQNPDVAPAWIRLGEMQASRNNLLEALKAFQEAEKFPLKTPERLRARWGVAQIYVQTGKAGEALSLLQGLLEEHPEAYLQKPEIYRTLGEAAFAVKDLAASRNYLMRYINLAGDVPDKDIVLARIAETYLHEGNRTQADKLYAHIQVHYPDSEGDIIGRLRKAEYYETQGPELREEAFKIYQDLESRQSTGPLKYFIQFKLAYGEFLTGQHEKCLERIDAVLKSADKAPVYDDLRLLRRKVLQTLVKRRFEAGDVKGVITLYTDDPFAFQDQEAAEVLAYVAQSYESLNLFPEALALYENLAQKDPKPQWRLAMARMAYELGHLEKAHAIVSTVSDPGFIDAKEKLLIRIAFAMRDCSAVLRVGESLAKRHGGPDQCPVETAALVALSLFETGKEEAAMSWAQACFRRTDWQDPSLLVALSLKASRYRQKNRMYDQAVQLLDQGIDKVHSEDLRNQLMYEKASLLLEQGKREEAEKVLSILLQSPKELWKTAAKQKLDYLRMSPWNSWTPEKDANAS